MASTSNILVIGVARGLGKELVTQLSANPQNNVLGTSRHAVEIGLPNVKILTLDQTSASSVQEAATLVPELDTIILNGAIGGPEKILSTSEDRLQQYLDTNVIGVFRIVQAFLPALRAGKSRKIVFISSQSGSMERQVDAKRGFTGPYAVSKAACNMLAVQLHNELHEAEGFTVVTMHPGWIATDMGKLAGDGGMPVSKSAEGVLKVVESLKFEDSAKFLGFDGSTLPW